MEPDREQHTGGSVDGDAEEAESALAADSASETDAGEEHPAQAQDKFPWEALFPVRETGDFALVIWTRRVCLAGDTERARYILEHFPFWFGPDTNALSQVFWTENHMLAVLTSEYLLRRLVDGSAPARLHEKLMSLLALKARAGMAEFLSAVYLPYSLGAVLNVFDFVDDPQMRQHCEDIVQKVSVQIAHVMLEDGMYIAPCGRTYPKFLRRTYGHHLQEFIAFIADLPLEQVGLRNAKRSQFLREIIRTTTYRPDVRLIRAAARTYGVQITLDVSPSRSDVMELANEWVEKGYRADEVVCLLWSHGLFAPRGKMGQLKEFVNQCKLWNHPHFRSMRVGMWVASCAPSSMLAWLAGQDYVDHYRGGSELTGARLTVYREPGVVLASLVRYNQGHTGYQQWPWVVNVAGTPVWAALHKRKKQERGEAEDIIMATDPLQGVAKGFPVITQVDNVLRADYSSLREHHKNHTLRVFWLMDQFDQHDAVKFLNSEGRMLTWRYGVKKNAVVAFRINQRRSVVHVVVKSLLAEHELPAVSAVASSDSAPPSSTTATSTHLSDSEARCPADLLRERLSDFLCTLPHITLPSE